MALWHFSNKNKHGNWRSRVVCLDGPLSHPGGAFGTATAARRFKYKYEHPAMAPTLLNLNGKTYLMPMWEEVVNGTTLNDIEWVKPVVKVTEVEKFEFKSSSSNKVYVAKRYTKPDGEVKLTCSCAGAWRAFDRRCKHIKSLEK